MEREIFRQWIRDEKTTTTNKKGDSEASKKVGEKVVQPPW